MQRVSRRVGGAPSLLRTTYINFDTDGGNNSGECYRAMRAMVDQCDVVGGLSVSLRAQKYP